MSDVLDVSRPTPHVARVWLNRPDVRNAFNDEVIAALTRTFEDLASDKDLRVRVAGWGYTSEGSGVTSPSGSARNTCCRPTARACSITPAERSIS